MARDSNSPQHLTLIAKANPTPCTPDQIKAMLRRAEQAAASVLSGRKDWVEAERSRLRALDFRLREEDIDQQLLDDIYLTAHDLRGQADYLDMPMLAELGHVLCQTLDDVDDELALPRDLLGLYLNTFRLILRQEVTGEDNEEVRAIIDSIIEASVACRRDCCAA